MTCMPFYRVFYYLPVLSKIPSRYYGGSTGGRRAGRGTGGSGLTTLNTLATFCWPHPVLGASADCKA